MTDGEELGIIILVPSQVETKLSHIVVLLVRVWPLGLQIDASRASWSESIGAAIFLCDPYMICPKRRLELRVVHVTHVRQLLDLLHRHGYEDLVNLRCLHRSHRRH